MAIGFPGEDLPVVEPVEGWTQSPSRRVRALGSTAALREGVHAMGIASRSVVITALHVQSATQLVCIQRPQRR